MCFDKVAIDMACLDDQVLQAVHQGEVGTQARRQVDIGFFSGSGAARIDDDQPGPVGAMQPVEDARP